MVSVQGLDTLIVQLTKNISGIDSHYPFLLKVVVPGMHVTPRHPMFEYLLNVGYNLIVPIVKHHKIIINDDGIIDFVFPERYLSVHEQHMFLEKLRTHPQAKEIKVVRIITQEPLIVSNTRKECVGIFDISSDDPDAGEVEGR